MAKGKGSRPDMKGNKYALGNNGGRPPIYKPEDLPQLFKDMLADFMSHQSLLHKHKTPIFIEKWAREHGLSDQTLRSYSEQDEEFTAAYKECRQIQKEILIVGGLKGYFNPTAYIFTAKNITDMRDKSEVEDASAKKEIESLRNDLKDLFSK